MKAKISLCRSLYFNGRCALIFWDSCRVSTKSPNILAVRGAVHKLRHNAFKGHISLSSHV